MEIINRGQLLPPQGWEVTGRRRLTQPRIRPLGGNGYCGRHIWPELEPWESVAVTGGSTRRREGTHSRFFLSPYPPNLSGGLEGKGAGRGPLEVEQSRGMVLKV